ncbi:hypothetical protein P7K49_032360 [Saguinus oedipus]|uniref:Cyclodeaminase/cyclohydrolase domain-containing protein n=1 Tax=Saguinus oedipus TaxID=9490 RepID=A0ABQ9TYU0_SAGOE|nr:hypothetical protein P7K49_032360 [Saguinus oedipus]
MRGHTGGTPRGGTLGRTHAGSTRAPLRSWGVPGRPGSPHLPPPRPPQSPVPQGAALGSMVGLMTYGRRQFQPLDAAMRRLIPPFREASAELTALVDADAEAFAACLVSGGRSSAPGRPTAANPQLGPREKRPCECGAQRGSGLAGGTRNRRLPAGEPRLEGAAPWRREGTDLGQDEGPKTRHFQEREARGNLRTVGIRVLSGAGAPRVKRGTKRTPSSDNTQPGADRLPAEEGT